MTTRVTPPTQEELERRAAESDIPGVVFVDADEWYAMFDHEVRERMGMSGAEFIERWKAGEYAAVVDKAGHRHIGYLGTLIPTLSCPALKES
jgi:hypothetical protein